MLGLREPRVMVFGTKPKLIKYTSAYAIEEGYTVCAKDKTPKIVLLQCGTQDCPFMERGRKTRYGWEIERSVDDHNHRVIRPGPPPVLQSSQVSDIEAWTDLSLSSRSTIAKFQQKYPRSMATMNEVQGVIDLFRAKQTGIYSPIKQLLLAMVVGKWKFDKKQGEDENSLDFFLFTNPKMIETAKKYNRVFFIGTVPDTNRHDMMLVHMSCLTPFNKTNPVAFCFMKNDERESFKWALESFKSFLDMSFENSVIYTDPASTLLKVTEECFPDSSHLWDVSLVYKDVELRILRIFCNGRHKDIMCSWSALLKSKNERSFQSSISVITPEVKRYRASFMKYLQNTWLNEKKKYVDGWTRKILHFDNMKKERLESIQRDLATFIGRSTGDIFRVFRRLEKYIELEEMKTSCKLLEDRAKLFRPRDNDCHREFYQNLYKRVSLEGLLMIHKQVCKSHRSPLEPCQHWFMPTTGLPCVHVIVPYLEKKKPFPLHLIHPFWIIDPEYSNPEWKPEHLRSLEHVKTKPPSVPWLPLPVPEAFSELEQKELRLILFESLSSEDEASSPRPKRQKTASKEVPITQQLAQPTSSPRATQASNSTSTSGTPHSSNLNIHAKTTVNNSRPQLTGTTAPQRMANFPQVPTAILNPQWTPGTGQVPLNYPANSGASTLGPCQKACCQGRVQTITQVHTFPSYPGMVPQGAQPNYQVPGQPYFGMPYQTSYIQQTVPGPSSNQAYTTRYGSHVKCTECSSILHHSSTCPVPKKR